jgi:hypothetical protein
MDGLCSFELDELPSISGLNPTNAEIGNQEAHHVPLSDLCNKGGSMAISAVAT